MNRPRTVRNWYQQFDTPVTSIDCGTKCAPNNPNGIPFCCDICHAVPAAYDEEWRYLKPATNLWQPYSGTECANSTSAPLTDVPDNMILLACLGPDKCQRNYRAISCRQFPFFPYITSDFRFIGLAYEWKFENSCWVIQNLKEVTTAYRKAFVAFYDQLFDLKMEEMESYSILSGEMRAVFVNRRKRIPVLHRNGNNYLISPGSERMMKTQKFNQG